MSVCFTPDISFTVGSTALLLQFAIYQDDGSGADPPVLVPIPDADTVNVTWKSPNGQSRLLSLISRDSAVFGWTTSAHEFVTPHTEIGRMFVSTASGGAFWTSTFVVTVNPVF